MLAPMLHRTRGDDPSEVFESLRAATSCCAAIRRSRSVRATIAGIDIALWNLFAKRANTPLWRDAWRCDGWHARLRQRHQPGRQCPAGGSCDAPWPSRVQAENRFNADKDRQSPDLRKLVGDSFLAVDVNQGWGIEQALQLAPPLEESTWRAGGTLARRSSVSEWRSLQKRLTIPLAGGENIAGRENFAAA